MRTLATRAGRSIVTTLLRPDWPAPAHVHACTTQRDAHAGISQPPFDRFNLGSNSGDEPAAVATNRAALRGLARLPAEPRWLKQVHGTRVMRFTAAETTEDRALGADASLTPRDDASEADTGVISDDVAPGADTGVISDDVAPEADAAVTSDAGVVLAILTADCLPVLLCSRDGRELGAAHAGWRGLAGGVLEATVAAMTTPASDLLAWLGPAAGPASYEIGEDVRAAFSGFDDAFVATRPGHWKIDLYAIARRKLAAAGVAAVHGGGFDTIADRTRFFSYRRDGRCGRFATLIWR